MLDYKPKPFDLAELAFFWNPRRWVEIVARFGEARAGSSDIRDAIIEVDDEGGHGFLHWHKDLQAWALTDKGKRWVNDSVLDGSLSSRRRNRERTWALPEEAKEPEPVATIQEIVEMINRDEVPGFEQVAAKSEESLEDELARLAAEQAADDVAG